jgi:hypothetical protein
MPFPPLINVQANEAEILQASSWLRYNDVLLTELHTEGYDMDVVRSDDGAQKLVTHHVLKVLALFNPAMNSFIPSGSTVGRAAVQPDISVIHERLMTDRASLAYAIGGKIILDTGDLPAGATTGPMHGPKPLYCQVSQVTGTASFLVRYGVEYWTDACTDNGGTRNYIQSHRFSMIHDVDGDTWLTTRMVAGQVTFRPELLSLLDEDGQDVAPDQILSPNVFPPVPHGFKRQNVRVQATPDGKQLHYSFTDVEQVLPLGSLSPGTKLTAEFSIGTSIAEGKPAATQAMVHVSAVGPKNEYRFNLLVMAIRIAIRKVQKPGLLFVQELQINYSLDQMFVDLSMRAVWKPVAVGMEGLQLNDTGLKASDDQGDLDNALAIFRDIGEAAQGSQSNLAQAPVSSFSGRKGTYLGLCIGSALVNGCFTAAQPDNWVINTSNEKVVEFQPDVDQEVLNPKDMFGQNLDFSLEVTPALTITLYSTGLSLLATGGAGLYEEWYQTTRYHTSHQKAVLPIGRAVSASPGDDIGVYSQPQVATLGLPYTLKSVDWTIAWIGPDPSGILLPSPDSGDTNDVLLAEDVTPAVPTVVNSSHKSWRVSGTYWYVSKRLRSASATVVATFPSLGADQGFSPGRSITDPYNRQTNTIGQSRFVAGYSPSFVG